MSENIDRMLEKFSEFLIGSVFVLTAIKAKDFQKAAVLEKSLSETLRIFIKFLIYAGRSGAEDAKYVAQCRLKLIYQIKNLLNILSIVESFPDIKLQTALARRDLLMFELLIFKYKFLAKDQNKNKTPAEVEKRAAIKIPSKFRSTKRKIIVILREGGGPVLNSDIFNRLGVSRRNAKKNLHELIEAGLVSRVNKDKKVFYELKQR